MTPTACACLFEDLTMTTYVYHYCASYQKAPGITALADGILVRKTPVTSWPECQNVKEAIAAIDGWPADGFTLNSLSFLHQTED